MSTEVGNGRLRVLHLILNLGETNGQYNEHCLPMVEVRDISICTYMEPQLTPPESIRLFAGDGSLRGFHSALRDALDASDYDVIHVHAPQTGALAVVVLLATMRYAKVRRSLVYTVQDSFHDYPRRSQALLVMSFAAYRRVVFCSNSAYESVPRIWRWLVRGRWRVAQNAADVDRIDRALEENPVALDSDTFTVISVGRLEPVKDSKALLEAFAMSSDERSRLVMVGTGSLEADVRAHITKLGLDSRVTMTGLIPRDEVFVRCAEADVLVSTSHGEGLPVAVIEAMASRCPVILSDIPPHRELADGAEFIPIVPIGDTPAFAAEIRRFRDMDPTARREIGEQGRAHVLARYTLPIMHAAVEDVYQEVSEKAPNPA